MLMYRQNDSIQTVIDTIMKRDKPILVRSTNGQIKGKALRSVAALVPFFGNHPHLIKHCQDSSPEDEEQEDFNDENSCCTEDSGQENQEDETFGETFGEFTNLEMMERQLDEHDDLHVVWGVTDDEDVRTITEAFQHIDSLYIADGHHRTAAACRFVHILNGIRLIF